MARALGRSVETEQRVAIARIRRANGGGVPLDGRGELPTTKRSSAYRIGRGGLVALEMILIVLFGLGLSSAALHSARPESACVSCTVERN